MGQPHARRQSFSPLAAAADWSGRPTTTLSLRTITWPGLAPLGLEMCLGSHVVTLQGQREGAGEAGRCVAGMSDRGSPPVEWAASRSCGQACLAPSLHATSRCHHPTIPTIPSPSRHSLHFAVGPRLAEPGCQVGRKLEVCCLGLLPCRHAHQQVRTGHTPAHEEGSGEATFG